MNSEQESERKVKELLELSRKLSGAELLEASGKILGIDTGISKNPVSSLHELWDKLSPEDQEEFYPTVLEALGYGSHKKHIDGEDFYLEQGTQLKKMSDEALEELRKNASERVERRRQLAEASRAYVAGITPEYRKEAYERFIKRLNRFNWFTLKYYLKPNLPLWKRIKGILGVLISPLVSITRWPEKKANFKKWFRKNNIDGYFAYLGPRAYRRLYYKLKFKYEAWKTAKQIDKLIEEASENGE